MTRHRVAVVGGGIVGLAVAWQLARRGVTDVVVCERRSLASQTTGRAAALLTRVRTPQQTALTTATRQAIAALQTRLGDSFGLRRVGSLHVAAGPATAAALAALVERAEGFGEPVTWLSPAAVHERVPWLRVDDVQRAALMPEDAYVDPHRLAMGFARAAAEDGVRLLTSTPVTGLLRDGARVVGVATATGAIEADHVVDAAGPWAGLLAWQAGWHLPMAPVRSHFWITEPLAGVTVEQPFVILPDAHAFARPEVGAVLFGLRDRHSASRDPRELPEDMGQLHFPEDPEGWQVLADRGPALQRFFPALSDLGIAHYVAGMSGYTADGQFVLGALPGIEGFLVAAGCCGAGIAVCGGLGQAIADLIVDGCSSLDLAPFRPDRFGAIDAFAPAWLERCASTRSSKTSG